MSKRLLLSATCAGVLLLGACGGASDGTGTSGEIANRTDGCTSEGATAQTPDGVPLLCVMNSVGQLMWDFAPETSSESEDESADGSSTNANRYDGCSSEGATAQSPDGAPLRCVLNTAGELMWDAASTAAANDNEPASGSLNAAFGGECDPDGPKKYTTGVGNADHWAYVLPLGEMNFSHITPVDHLYMYYPKDAQQRPAGAFAVTSPADGAIVDVQDFRKMNNWPYPDFRIVISHSCDLYTVFIHIGALKGAAAQVEALIPADGLWRGNIPVKAGEVIGDRSEAPKFDFSTFATAAKANLLNPASYERGERWKPFTANPYDYFPAEVAKTYEAKTLRTKQPVGGTIFYDIPGTAQGVWFVADTNGYAGIEGIKSVRSKKGFNESGYWDTHLAIAPHFVDTSTFVYSIGDWDGCPCQFVSKGNVDPKTIKAGGAPVVVDLISFGYVTPSGEAMDIFSPVKDYKLLPKAELVGSLAIQVNADGTMTVEKRPKKTAASFTAFGPDALVYSR